MLPHPLSSIILLLFLDPALASNRWAYRWFQIRAIPSSDQDRSSLFSPAGFAIVAPKRTS